ncbi:MAG: KpsF/GutQ family sugar-phosphate isomerase [Alphaproteobacteria bacterium HGW-Alphaproteobacteria-1]|jgi:arabinose-5-phosphate isomerase|nr:MAG: KpsF/GutQ family sugar-phosphate isomerase [Alphaproteobacteria bacterium HGW-Alphaproteobacteria-1]
MTGTAENDHDRIRGVATRVLRAEAEALMAMADCPPEGFARATRMILASQGRVVTSGMGKSGHIARKIAATLASTGTPALFLHPGEASHGDLGMVAPGDVCILLSNSGETRELSDLIQYTRRFDIPMIAITRVADSTLARQADVALILPDKPEACAIGMAPTTSTTCTLALGDALAVALMEERGFKADAFHVFHPGGKLGAQFLRVRDVMHTGAALPQVAPETPMGETLIEMSAKGFGIAALVEDGILRGVITDGDLRRNLDGLMGCSAGAVATRDPRTATPDMLLSEALGVMNRHKIGALFVVEAGNRLCGLVHIHDCLRAGVA